MSSIKEKFEIDDIFYVQDGLLFLNTKEIRGIKEFRNLLASDKGSPGDHDGRKKYYSTKVLMFIWFYYNWKSPLAKYPDRERFTQSLKEAKLKPGWGPNEVETIAANKYVELLEGLNPDFKLLQTIERGLNVSNKVVENLVNNMEENLEDLSSLQQGSLSDADKALIMQKQKTLEEGIDNLIGKANKLPKAIDEVMRLKEKVRKQVSQKKQIWGGGELGNRENPR